MDWINTKEEMPRDGERVLTWNERRNEPCIQVFNKSNMCWDTEDGDDYEYDVNDIDWWMPLPEIPYNLKILQRGW